MGGNALKKVKASRLDLQTYEEVKRLILAIVSRYFTCCAVQEVRKRESVLVRVMSSVSKVVLFSAERVCVSLLSHSTLYSLPLYGCQCQREVWCLNLPNL